MGLLAIQKIARERAIRNALTSNLNTQGRFLQERFDPGTHQITFEKFRHLESWTWVQFRLAPELQNCKRFQMLYHFKDFRPGEILWAYGEDLSSSSWRFMAESPPTAKPVTPSEKFFGAAILHKILAYLLLIPMIFLVTLLALLFVPLVLLLCPLGLLIGLNKKYRTVSYAQLALQCLVTVPLTVIGALTLPRAIAMLAVWLGFPQTLPQLMPHPLIDLPWGFIGISFTIFAVVLDHFWRNKQIEQLRLLPLSKVRSAAIGLCELKGVARPLDRQNAGTLILGAATSQKKPFFLEDETGRILIDPTQASLRLTKANFFGGRVNEMVLSPRPEWQGIGALYEGESLYVIGRVERNPFPPPIAQHDSEKLWIRPRKPDWLRLDFNDVFFLTDGSEQGAINRLRQGVRQIWGLAVVYGLASVFLLFFGFAHLKHSPVVEKKVVEQVVAHFPALAAELHRLNIIEDVNRKKAELIAELQKSPAQNFERLAAPLDHLGERELLHKTALEILYAAQDPATSAKAVAWLKQAGEPIPYAWKRNKPPAVFSAESVYLKEVILELQGENLFISYEVYFGERFFQNQKDWARVYVTLREMTSSGPNSFTLGAEVRKQLQGSAGFSKISKQKIFSGVQEGDYWVSVSAAAGYQEQERYKSTDAPSESFHLRQ